MIYLASPYSHDDPAVREARFRAVCLATAALIRAGNVVFSPVVHSHPLASFGLPTTWEFWAEQDRHYLACCDELVVLMLDGWEDSVGVREEIRIAKELGKPVRHLETNFGSVCQGLGQARQSGLANRTPTLAHVATKLPGADQAPTVANRPLTLAHVASEVPA